MNRSAPHGIRAAGRVPWGLGPTVIFAKSLASRRPRDVPRDLVMQPSANTPSPAASDSKSNGPSRGSLLVIFLCVFIDLLGFGMVLPLLPIYAKTFGVKEEGLVIGLLMSSFSAMTFIFAPL